MTLAGCGGGGNSGDTGNGEEGRLDDTLKTAITHFWEGTGVPADVPVRFGYKFSTHKSTTACQHLAEADRWYAERTSVLDRGEREQKTMVDATVAYFQREGFTVSRWKTSATDAPVRYGFIGHRDTTAIEVTIDPQGRTDLAIRMGPCATPTLDGFTEPLYERTG